MYAPINIRIGNRYVTNDLNNIILNMCHVYINITAENMFSGNYYIIVMHLRLNDPNRVINRVRKRILVIVQIWQPRKPISGKTVSLTK